MRDETIVGGIYLRVFNLRPKSVQLDDPSRFAANVLTYISSLLDEEVKRPDVLGGISTAIEALLNLVAGFPKCASPLSTQNAVDVLVRIVGLDGPGDGPIKLMTVELMRQLMEHPSFMDALGTHGQFFARANACLAAAVGGAAGALPQAKGLVHLLRQLSASPSAVAACLSHGTVVCLLHVCIDGEVDEPLRKLVASILQRLLADRGSGSMVLLALGVFLPDGLIAVLRDEEGDALVRRLGQSVETPELLWDEGRLSRVRAHLAVEVASLLDGRGGTASLGERGTWIATGKYVDVDSSDVLVAGVYVRRYIKDPAYPLRDRRRFCEALLARYSQIFNALESSGVVADENGPEERVSELDLLGAALLALLKTHPGLAESPSQLGYLSKIVVGLQARAASASEGGGLDNASVNQALGILQLFAGNRRCASALSLESPPIVPVLRSFLRTPEHRASSVKVLEVLLHGSNAERGAVSAQAESAGMCGALLELLADTEVDQLVRIHTSAVLKLMAEDSNAVTAELELSPVWASYKDQRHDLFFLEGAPGGRLLTG